MLVLHRTALVVSYAAASGGAGKRAVKGVLYDLDIVGLHTEAIRILGAWGLITSGVPDNRCAYL